MAYEEETKYFWKCEKCGKESVRFVGNGDEEAWWTANGWVMDLPNDKMLCKQCAAQQSVHPTAAGVESVDENSERGGG